jgi:hypothetical protein
MSCTIRVLIDFGDLTPEAEYLWRGHPCARCRKPLGFDGVALFCSEHGEWGSIHAIHKTCLDGVPLAWMPKGRQPVSLHEVLLQLPLFKE